jgi:hypothetical protein
VLVEVVMEEMLLGELLELLILVAVEAVEDIFILQPHKILVQVALASSLLNTLLLLRLYLNSSPRPSGLLLLA